MGKRVNNEMQPQHPNFKYTGREPDMAKQPARSYIKERIDTTHRSKLLNGLEEYLRYVKKVNFSNYSVTDLASELPQLAKRNGVGKRSMQELKQQLKADGWL